MSKNILKDSWKYALILLLIIIPLFQHLGSLTIRLWDESRLAINAYEMYHSGNYLVPTYDGAPDMWNTKPPLMIWLQVLSMKLFGVNETALRLPSAFAALFTCLLILLIAVRYVKNFWFGFICVLVLITSSGYLGLHAVRFGEYDALLTLFLTLGCFSFFFFIETAQKKYIYFFFISLALAVLTKSSAALMILPGIFIYTLIKKKLLFLLKNKDVYIGLLVFLLLCGCYYFLRELYNPGYLQAVMQNEFGGRFFGTIEGHKHGFWYYYENLIDNRYTKWIFLLPCGILTGILSKNMRIKNLTLFSTITIFAFFLVISSAQTKLRWYDLPLYPFLAILVGIFIHFIFLFLKEEKRIFHYLKSNIIPYVFLFLIFIAPYREVVNKTYKQKEDSEDFYRVNYFLRDILRGKIQKDNFLVIYDGKSWKDWDTSHIKFYLNLLQEQGKNISLKKCGDVTTGKIVLIYQDESKEFLEEKYDINVIDEFYNLKIYEIIGEK